MPIFVLPFPVIDPVAVNIGPLPLRWYALAYIGGFIFGWLGLRALAAKFGPRFEPPQLLRDMAAKGESFYGRFMPQKLAA